MTMIHGSSHDRLVQRASVNRQRAYAPYSGFRAGAVVTDDDGTEHDGVIVENVSLGLAMCAERVALFAAVAAGGAPRRLALVAPRTGDALTWPCGACLQTALELGGPDLEVVVSSPDQIDAGVPPTSASVAELLPSGPHLPGRSLAGTG